MQPKNSRLVIQTAFAAVVVLLVSIAVWVVPPVQAATGQRWRIGSHLIGAVYHQVVLLDTETGRSWRFSTQTGWHEIERYDLGESTPPELAGAATSDPPPPATYQEAPADLDLEWARQLLKPAPTTQPSKPTP